MLSAIRAGIAIVFLVAAVQLATRSAAADPGVIAGHVMFDTNEPVDHASVSVTGPSGAYRMTTDGRGFFAGTGIAPGTYTISMTAPGFQQENVFGIEVSPNETTVVNINAVRQLTIIGR